MAHLKRLLELVHSKLSSYTHITSVNFDNLPNEHSVAYRLAKSTLESKQCNEPYEQLLSDVLGLNNIPAKHGWDANNLEVNPNAFYEFKPCKKSKNPSGTINDDTEDKINKCAEFAKMNETWLVLAGINTETYTFDCIYKFNMTIYDYDRRKYLKNLVTKNKSRLDGKQTRSTYNITVKKSIKLSEDQGKPYYVWVRE